MSFKTVHGYLYANIEYRYIKNIISKYPKIEKKNPKGKLKSNSLAKNAFINKISPGRIFNDSPLTNERILKAQFLLKTHVKKTFTALP